MSDATFPSLPESHYRDLLARQLGGQVEVKLTFGRADVVTETHVFEVEPATRWRLGARQALQYAAQVPQRGALAVYGDSADLLQMFTQIRLLPEPGLEFWWFDGDEFTLIEHVSDMARYVAAGRSTAMPARAGGEFPEDRIAGLADNVSLLTTLVIGLAEEHRQMRDRLRELEQATPEAIERWNRAPDAK
jgi:hypothetical protein